MTQPLPPLPGHPEPHTYKWTALEVEAIEAWGAEVRRQALKDAMRLCMVQADRWPGSVEKSCAAKECAAAIGALKAA